MAEEIKIDDIVDFQGFFKDAQTAIEWVNKIEVAIQKTGKADLSIKGISGIRSLKDSIDQLTNANKTLASSIANLEILKNRGADTDLKSAKASTENAKAKKLEAEAAKATANAKLAEAKAANENAKAKKLETQEKDRAEKTARQEQKLVDDIANDYKQLSIAYNEAALKAKNYSIRLGENHPLTLEAVKDAKQLSDFLKKIDASVGQNQRNVGNYGEAFSQALSKITEQIAKLKTEQQGLQDLGSRAPIGFTIGNQDRLNQVTASIQQLEQAQRVGFQTTSNYTQQIKNLDAAFEQLVSSGTQDLSFLKNLQQSIQQAKGGTTNLVKGFDSLQFSMQQLLRETPALAINMNTFFLAISNNLPQFFDAIEKAKAANINLAESGAKPIPVYQQLLKGLLSFQTVLTVGITLVTVYGSKIIDWFESLGKGGQSIEKLKKQLAGFNSEVKQSSEDLDLFFKYLDRLNKVPKVQIEIDNTNIPIITRMRNELQGLGKDAEDLQQKLNLSLEQFNKAVEAEGKTAAQFRNLATKEAIDAFDSGSIDAIKDKLSERDQVLIDALNTAKTNFNDANEKVSDLKTALDVTNKNIQLKTAEITKEGGEEARKIALDNATAIFNIVKTNNDAILSSDRSTLKERLNALRSNFEAEKNLIAARKNDVLGDPTSSGADRNAAIKQAIVEEKKLRSEFNETVFKEQEEFRLRDLEASKSYFVRQKEMQANAFKELANNLEFSLQDRLQFQRNYADSQKQILEAEYKQRLAAAGLSDEEIAAFEKDKNYKIRSKKITDAELLDLANEYETQILQLSIDSNKAVTENIKNEIKRQQDLRQSDVDAIETIYNRIDLNTSNRYAEDVIALNNSLNKKEISVKEYSKRRKKLEDDLSKDIIKNTIDEVLSQLRLMNGIEGTLSAAEIKLTSLRNKFQNAKTSEEKQRLSQEISVAQDEYNVAKDLVDKKIDLEKKLTDKKKEESDKRKKTAEEEAEDEKNRIVSILDAVASSGDASQIISDGVFDKKMQQISEEQAALEERYAKEKDLIDQTTANAIEKQQKLAEADVRYRAQKAALEQKERQEKRNKAILDKQIAIFSIIINTARAVVEALPNVPKAIAAGAVGAAQLFVAANAPIPKVFKGKNIGKSQSIDSYEGPAIVDEGPDGKGNAPEMIIRDNGRIEVGSNKPRITYLNKNDIVLPAPLTKDALLKRAVLNNQKALIPIQTVTQPVTYHDIGAERRHREMLNAMKKRRESHYHGWTNRDVIMKLGYDVIKKLG